MPDAHAHGALHGHHGHRHVEHRHVTTADGVEVPAGERIEPGEIAETQAHQKILWIDASQGAAGDMLLGALLDAGADAGSVAAVLDLVAPGKLHLEQSNVVRGPFVAKKVNVIADEVDPPARHLSDIEEMLDSPGVPDETRKLAKKTFRLIAEAEAKVHGSTISDVHFHEVGALDSIGDIVGCAEAIRTLGIASATSSVVAVGSGSIKTQHGLMSVPPPAVANLAVGWQIEAGGPPEVGELCTPTGMALIRAVCSEVGPTPEMTLEAVGLGAGTRVRKDRDGLLRVMVGLTDASSDQFKNGEMFEISTNVDDMDPRVYPAVIQALLDAGASDAWLTPVMMKKGRPAHIVTALASSRNEQPVVDAMLTHTSTIGVRISSPMHRSVLMRASVPVEVNGVEVQIKISGDGRKIRQVTPEFTDVEQLSDKLDIPVIEALSRARQAAFDRGLSSGAEWSVIGDD